MIETRQCDGHTLDVLTVGDLRIMVSRLGAEMVSLARRDANGDWQGFLYRDGDVSQNPSGWNYHSTLMGFYAHRILNEQTKYHGKIVRGSTHGFLRRKTFDAPLESETSLEYKISAEVFLPDDYPYKVDFSIRYELENDQLTVQFRCENREDTESHVSFGLHPGFAGLDVTRMEILLPPGRYKRHLAPGNFLSGEIEIIDFAGGSMPFAVNELPGCLLLDLEEVPQRIFVVRDPVSGRQSTLNYSEAPYLTLWSDGGPFICVEPCWGMPDHHVQRAFEDKLGMQLVPPHGSLTRRFSIKPELVQTPL